MFRAFSAKNRRRTARVRQVQGRPPTESRATGEEEEKEEEATMLEIRSTKYARQLNLTFSGKDMRMSPTRLEGGRAQKASMSAPRPPACPPAPYMPQAASVSLSSSSSSSLLLSCKFDSLTSSKFDFFPTAELIVAIDWGIQNSSPLNNVAGCCVLFR